MREAGRSAGGWVADALLYVETFFLVGLLFGFEALYVTDYARFPGDYLLLLAGIALGHAILGAAIGLPAALVSALVRWRGGARSARAVRFLHILACGTFLLLPQFVLFWIEWARPISLGDRHTRAGLLVAAAIALGPAGAVAFAARAPRTMRRCRRALGGVTLAASLLLFAGVPIYTLLAGAVSRPDSRGAALLPGTPSATEGSSLPGPSPTAAAGSAAAGSSPVLVAETGRKVVVIGLDGASWSVIERLGKAGKLPNLTRLTASGASGPLESIVSRLTPFADISSGGMRSNVLWTSIATGKTPRKHGIHDFLFTRIAGISHPFPARLPLFEVCKRVFHGIGTSCLSYEYPTRLSRRCMALWNIASEMGRRVAVIGWWMTRPAERMNGWMIADRPYDRFSVYPADERLLAAVDAYHEGIKGRASRVERFTTFPFDPDYRKHLSPSSPGYFFHYSLDHLTRDFVFDEIKARLAVEEIETGDADLVMLYFFGPDDAEHYFWKYYDPEPFGDVPAEEIDRFGGVIKTYYAYLDSVVGAISDRVDDDTVLLLCSDHGMGPWTEDRKGFISSLFTPGHQVNSGNHRKEGIIILQGAGIREGARLDGASVLDVLPTALALLGLPVARDLDGRVLDAAFTPAFRERFPRRVIGTYETGGEAASGATWEGDTKQGIERLRALGYIE